MPEYSALVKLTHKMNHHREGTGSYQMQFQLCLMIFSSVDAGYVTDRFLDIRLSLHL